MLTFPKKLLKHYQERCVSMSVNSISTSSSFGYVDTSQCSNKLSDSTKRKLQALGIDPSSVTSETQAQALIASAQQKQQIQQTKPNDNNKQVNSSESELISQAKTLASKMGVSVSSNETLSDILSSLSSKISSMSAEANGDTTKIQDIKQFQSELFSIQSQYSSVQQSDNNLFSAMNMTANMNKYILGLS